MSLPPDFDPAQARRIAGDLEDLQLKLRGGEFNGYRHGILVGSAVLRWLAECADGVAVVEPLPGFGAVQAGNRITITTETEADAARLMERIEALTDGVKGLGDAQG